MMIIDIISQLNFLDIIILIILFRILYIAIKTGLAIELFKLLGVIFSTYVSLHYYTSISDLIQRRFLPKVAVLEFVDFIIFLVLAALAYLGFVALRSIFYRFMSLEATPKLNKFGGLILGLIRGFFVIGLLVFTLTICSVKYFSQAVERSYLGSRAVVISPRVYGLLWSGVVSKFSGKEKFNATVNEVMEKVEHK